MSAKVKMEVTTREAKSEDGGRRRQCLLLEVQLGKTAAETFHLETVVCSHGFFMMAPNRWDPVSKALFRPLRLALLHSPTPSPWVMVRISQPPHRPQCLHLHVYPNFSSTNFSLSPENEQALLV